MTLTEQDWTGAAAGLNAQGWALLPKLIDASAAARLRGLYDKEIFRSHVIMARHGFGRGEYKYFSYPLPDPIARLRPALYAHLAPIGCRTTRRRAAIQHRPACRSSRPAVGSCTTGRCAMRLSRAPPATSATSATTRTNACFPAD